MDMGESEMEKGRFTKTAVFLIYVIVSACLLTACFGSKVLFSCGAGNAAGIYRVDYRNGYITLYFEKETALAGEMKSIFEGDDNSIRVSVSGKYGTEEYGPANIKIDNELMKVEISTGMNSADNVGSILLICKRNQLRLDLQEAKLHTMVVVSTEGEVGPLRGPVTTTFRDTTQTYDKKSRTWSEPVQETRDMTIYQ